MRYSFRVWRTSANFSATPWLPWPIGPREPWKVLLTNSAVSPVAGREPGKIVAHMGDLFDWALSTAKGQERWHNSEPLTWVAGQNRFFASLQAFDAFLASGEPLHTSIEKLMQGPVADALTHVGQLAMLRRLAGCPTRGENFYVAAIAAGQVSAEQPAPVRTF
jgi:hypothetical protein